MKTSAQICAFENLWTVV